MATNNERAQMVRPEVRLDHPLLGGYGESELRTAFERVQNGDHWKGPIDVILLIQKPSELEAVEYAIEFYTATKAIVTYLGARAYRIQAPGYWAGPAN